MFVLMNFIYILPESIQTGLLPSLVTVDIIILGLNSLKLALTLRKKPYPS